MLANTVWAFAKLRIRDWPFIKSIACAARASMPQEPCKPQSLAKTAWACAKLSYHDETFMHAIA